MRGSANCISYRYLKVVNRFFAILSFAYIHVKVFYVFYIDIQCKKIKWGIMYNELYIFLDI